MKKYRKTGSVQVKVIRELPNVTGLVITKLLPLTVCSIIFIPKDFILHYNIHYTLGWVVFLISVNLETKLQRE
jgi:hypothetical protein